MALHEESDDYSFTDFKYDELDDTEKLNQKKKIKRLLDERLERKKLKYEFKDDFDELNGDFDWDELDK